MLIDRNHLTTQATDYLNTLCLAIPNRRVGSDGNRTAAEFFARIAKSFGFEVEMPVFECMDWQNDGVSLSVSGSEPAAAAESLTLEAFPSPYSLGCNVSAPLVVVSTVEELASCGAAGQLLLLRGEIAAEQLMPKNFPFYNPEGHQRIIQLLEQQQPQAIICATTRDTQMVGSQYPFALIEDGDFNIPSVYMTAENGDILAQYAGSTVHLHSRAVRHPATGCNVIARKEGNSDSRIVFFAHIDSKLGTPGATDNASGVTTLLLLAELLAAYEGELGIELVALNGEDYYSNPGEQQYLALNYGKFGNIALGVNIDGVGFHKGRTAFSLYDCAEASAQLIRSVIAAHQDISEGECWYQGDHVLFLLNQRPALAFTSELAMEMMTSIIHTPEDRPEIVDSSKLVTLAMALLDVVNKLKFNLEVNPSKPR